MEDSTGDGAPRDFSLGRVLEALRAVRDVDTNLHGAWCSFGKLPRVLVCTDVMTCIALHTDLLPFAAPICACAGLQELNKAITGRGGTAVLAQYLRSSPNAAELQAVWEAQLTVGAG